MRYTTNNLNKINEMTKEDVYMEAFHTISDTRIKLHNLCNQINAAHPECAKKILSLFPEIDVLAQKVYHWKE